LAQIAFVSCSHLIARHLDDLTKKCCDFKVGSAPSAKDLFAYLELVIVAYEIDFESHGINFIGLKIDLPINIEDAFSIVHKLGEVYCAPPLRATQNGCRQSEFQSFFRASTRSVPTDDEGYL
jgi:hypothetical protein